MLDRLKFVLTRLNERLWVRPLIACLVSTAAAFLASGADRLNVSRFVPDISPESIDTLLTIISSSMLVIATLAVTSMVSAYASASTTATPRTFSLVIADDVSQNALSTFIGIFIFSIIGLIAMKVGYYEKAGRFTLFALTLIAFAMVIFTFVHWVDRIARLGRLGGTMDKVEQATRAALRHRRRFPTLGGRPAAPSLPPDGVPVFGTKVGYVQRVDVAQLQACAQKHDLHVVVRALPGTFATAHQPLAYVTGKDVSPDAAAVAPIAAAFLIGNQRTFDDDPRFGLIVLAEIASRALSPAVNDPGTAIDIIGRFIRLFSQWCAPLEPDERCDTDKDRVSVPALALHDLFDDAFTPLARDGAGNVAVAIRLQKAFIALSQMDADGVTEAAREHSRLALARAQRALTLEEDIAAVRALALT
jgi:uncharacterized membrane protein